MSDDVVDIPVKMLADNLGRSLVDFELNAIARSLHQRSESVVRVDSVSDEQIWGAIDDFIQGEGLSLLILGVGASFYEHYPEMTLAQEKAEAKKKSIRFESVRGVADLPRAIFIAEPSTSFAVCRRELNMEEQAVYREQLPLQDGGVVSDVIEIDEDMKERWLEGSAQDERAEMRALYERSVVARTFWSFSVIARNGRFSVYMLPPDED
ncbi:hypothetical protein WQ53_09815 [Pseudoxanthomonas suwonensis]|uniref:Uncharacterized protein n=1 Tax=Pseudoxanthomonas suwonensis TaxID=314722 RepID=A0A0E3Z411_9GAMM|nr:hypothetical protein WQ53_09815 [Pseudoxanthomonas suwonensis]